MKRYLPWIGILAALTAVVVVAFGGGSSDPDPGFTGDSGIAVPDPNLLVIGESLYQTSCATCHGTDLRGTDLGPSHLSVVYEPDHHGDAAFLLAARNGVRQHHWQFGDMAPVPGLSDDDITAIVAYVREQQRINGFEPYPPAP